LMDYEHMQQVSAMNTRHMGKLMLQPVMRK
jgi:hypothetical protein